MQTRDPRQLSPESLSALLSLARLEVLEACQAYGPQTVAELAERLGLAPDRLYYHLSKLVEVDLLRQQAPRENARRGRNGAVYSAVERPAPWMRLDFASDASREVWATAARLILRRAGREVEGAIERGREQNDAIQDAGVRRNLRVERTKAWLRPEDLEELNRRLDELRDFLRERSVPGRGALLALTQTLTPLPAGTPPRRSR